MSPNFLEGHFHLPAQEEPLQDLSGRLAEVGAQQSSRFELAFGISYDHPTDGQREQTTVVPDGGAGGDLDQSRAVTIPMADFQPLPVRPGIGEDLLERGKTLTDQARSSLGIALALRRWFKQAGIQTQTCDTDDRPSSQSCQQLERGETAIRNQDQGAGGGPSLHLEDELACPVGEQLGLAFVLLPVASGRRQRGEERQV